MLAYKVKPGKMDSKRKHEEFSVGSIKSELIQ